MSTQPQRAPIGAIAASLLVAAALHCSEVVADKIYKSVDANGNTTYSDRPPAAGSKVEEVNLGQGNRFEGTQPDFEVAPSQLSKTIEEEQEEQVAHRYALVEVVVPANDQTIQDNQGTVNIFATVTPQLRGADHFQLLLDGVPQAVEFGADGQAQLTNVDRGDHQLVVQVVNEDGNVLAESAVVVFHLRRITTRQLSQAFGSDDDSDAPRRELHRAAGGATYVHGSGAAYQGDSGGAHSDGGGAHSDSGGAKSDGAGIVAPPFMFPRPAH